ncbi:4-hydroxythreonine-4-phosphate dehydrogenase PdxA [Geobacter sp.]|uniref:4-hydroxythreonine-4-phosphate dehydrogenase PdxA n=1 Tax=Geobacter sp. TaxID=46610 RepID=UPI0026100C1B|nr:4-hydroxythreonine-4-phosphate dehydrogenase PdxA [Geobacter sp.]
MQEQLPLIAVTMGDPAGIGPEIIVKALARKTVATACRPLVLGVRGAFERALLVTGVPLDIEPVGSTLPREWKEGKIYLREVAELGPDDLIAGRPTLAGGEAVFRCIEEAARLCLDGTVQGMATAPINKEALNRAGHHYPGHTELLAELTGTEKYVMMLAGKRLRVALATIHVALSDVPRLVTMERVLDTIRVTHRDVHRYFRPHPRIAVLSLNPHCGEGGMFGDEELTAIAPAVAAARGEGIDAVGPLSADTLFHFAARGEYDAVVCMYHDQGLIPLKLLHFEDGVNVTLGLPIIRTSVDHGTAYDLAGTGAASELSMCTAIEMAAAMARVRGADGAAEHEGA